MASTRTTSLSKLAFAAGATTLLLGLLISISNDLLATSSSTSPPLLSTLDIYLSPPYLFLTVNLIILTVWKLSSTSPPEPTKELVTAATSDIDRDDNDAPKTHRIPVSTARVGDDEAADQGTNSDSSCVTSDTDEAPPESPTIGDTWQAIRGSGRMVAEEVAVCTDEMDRRFDAFIKKINDQMRMERHE